MFFVSHKASIYITRLHAGMDRPPPPAPRKSLAVELEVACQVKKVPVPFVNPEQSILGEQNPRNLVALHHKHRLACLNAWPPCSSIIIKYHHHPHPCRLTGAQQVQGEQIRLVVLNLMKIIASNAPGIPSIGHLVRGDLSAM